MFEGSPASPIPFLFLSLHWQGNKIIVHERRRHQQSLILILPKRCLPNPTLESLHLSRDGPVIRCTPARIGPEGQWAQRSVALPQVQPWRVHMPSWGRRTPGRLTKAPDESDGTHQDPFAAVRSLKRYTQCNATKRPSHLPLHFKGSPNRGCLDFAMPRSGDEPASG